MICEAVATLIYTKINILLQINFLFQHQSNFLNTILHHDVSLYLHYVLVTCKTQKLYVLVWIAITKKYLLTY